MKIFILFLIVISSFGFLIAEANTTSAQAEFKMTLLLEETNPIIKEYEIEFWQTDKTKDASELPVQKILKPGRNILVAPPHSNFFRVRAVALLNIRGYWTEMNPIKRYPLAKAEIPSVAKFEVPKPIILNDILVKLLNKNGQLESYLAYPDVFIREPNESKKTKHFFRINEGVWQESKNESIKFPSDGRYRLEYYSLDVLGNRGSIKLEDFIVDRTPPITNILLLGEIFKTNQFIFINDATKISLEASDENSGVSSTRYRATCIYPNSQEWTTYQEPILIKRLYDKNCKTGELYFEYYSTDRIGNDESINLMRLMIPKSSDQNVP